MQFPAEAHASSSRGNRETMLAPVHDGRLRAQRGVQSHVHACACFPLARGGRREEGEKNIAARGRRRAAAIARPLCRVSLLRAIRIE